MTILFGYELIIMLFPLVWYFQWKNNRQPK